jgi:hypothetical protein
MKNGEIKLGPLFAGLFPTERKSLRRCSKVTLDLKTGSLLPHERRLELGSSIWLWFQLSMRANLVLEKRWCAVDGVYTDEDLAIMLGSSAATARRWRMRLEKAGLIRTFRVGPRQRRFELLTDFGRPAMDQAIRKELVQ